MHADFTLSGPQASCFTFDWNYRQGYHSNFWYILNRVLEALCSVCRRQVDSSSRGGSAQGLLKEYYTSSLVLTYFPERYLFFFILFTHSLLSFLRPCHMDYCC